MRRLMVLLYLCLLLTATVAAQGATVVAFSRVPPNGSITVSNPQVSSISGQFRLVPRVGQNAPAAVAFTLAAGEVKTFPVTALGIVEAGIVKIESTDLLETAELAFATPTRPASTTFSFLSGSTLTVLVGALTGEVRVQAFATAGSTVPTATRTVFAGTDERTYAFTAAELFGTTYTSSPFITVTPVTGNAVVTSSYVPSRVRAVRQTGPAPEYFSLNTPGCAQSTGATATVVRPTAGTRYGWSLVNGTAEGALTNTLLAFTLGTKGYGEITLTALTSTGVMTSLTGVLAITGVPTIQSVAANDVVDGGTTTIAWTVANATTGTLTGTDFPSQGVVVDLSKGSYSFSASGVGTHSFDLAVGNACGSTSKHGSFNVVPSCTTPSAYISVTSSTTEGSTITASMPSGASSYSWSVTGGTIQSGQGTRQISIVAGAAGTMRISGTASNGSCTASDTANVTVTAPAPSGSISAPATVKFGQSYAISITTANVPAGKQWSIASSNGNLFDSTSGSGSGTFTRTFIAAELGQDTVTLSVDGVVIASTTITVTPP